jgi:hypothetical protein
MRLPFTPKQFFDAFAHYNESVWPVQYVLLVLGLAAAISLLISIRTAALALPVVAFLWLWIALVYFIDFFSAVTPAAYVFAIGFALEGLFVAAWSTRFGAIDSPSRLQRLAAGALFLYAFLAYPLIGLAAGQHYPASVTFGLPCPTVIFTFGVLVLLAHARPTLLLVAPVAWAIIGTSAAVLLHVPQDLALLAAAMIAVAFVTLERNARRRHHEAHAF